MTKKLLYVVLLLLTLFLGYYYQKEYCYTGCTKPENSEQIINQDKPISEQNSFAFSANGVGYVCNQNFNFEKNGYAANMPAGDSIDRGINELKSFLEQNPKQKVKISGLYTVDEMNTSAFPNLGFARANSVKNYFVSKGIPSSRIEMTGTEVDQWDIIANKVKGPINLDIIDQNDASNNKDWSAIKRSFNDKPLQLNFDSGKAEIELSSEQRQMISNIAGYLDNVEGSSISIVGHTDNLGDRATNVKLGQERAEFAKAYLVKNGINADRINTSSMGPDQPIADNSQELGRSKNRRTVVILK